ncbi:MAG: hypothetical protein ACT4NY_18825 [Pseudonocardiales bacterium]
MRSDLFAPSHQETRAVKPGLVLQNSKMLKIALAGEVLVRQGSMVAYQGDVQFKALGSGGIKKFLKKALTVNGENVLAFEPTLSYDIRRVEGVGMLSSAGLFNYVFSGSHRDHFEGPTGGAQCRSAHLR